MAVYQWMSITLYDVSLFSNAASYAIERGIADSPNQFFTKTMVGLSFCGGCLVVVFFYSYFLGYRLILLSLGSAAAVLVGATAFGGEASLYQNDSARFVIFQFFLFVFVGFEIFFLAIADVYKTRNPESVFLLLWITGTFVFSSHINWTINARTILPMIPAVAILLSRRIHGHRIFRDSKASWPALVPLIPGIAVAFLVAWGDASYADCQRKMARYFHSGLQNYKYDVWFQGHWGFQYYMQEYGFRPLDYENSMVGSGDLIIIPKTNTGQVQLPLEKFTFLKKLDCLPLKWVSTLSSEKKAGFYSDTKTKLFLPFAFGEIAVEEYYVFIVDKIKDPEIFVRNLGGAI